MLPAGLLACGRRACETGPTPELIGVLAGQPRPVSAPVPRWCLHLRVSFRGGTCQIALPTNASAGMHSMTMPLLQHELFPFTCAGHQYDGAIMITASHLPFHRNGFKFFTKDGGAEKVSNWPSNKLAQQQHCILGFFSLSFGKKLVIVPSH